MPKKIRELKQMLRQAGFASRTGKGSHTNWFYPLYSGRITIAGRDGSEEERLFGKTGISSTRGSREEAQR